MDSSEYYWLPWLYTYQKLQAATRTGTAGFDKDLKHVQQWLQDGAARFKPPSEQSAAALKKGGNLKATAYGPGKGFAVDKQLVQATLELSQLLGLDELQTHLLLKRVIKEKGLKLSTQSAAATQPAAASSSAVVAAGGAAQSVLSAEDVQAVADAYGEERAYLVKCQHLVLKTTLDVLSPASAACRAVMKQLLDQDWASKVLSNLAQLLRPDPQATNTPAAAGPVHAVKPPAFDQHRYLQLLNERCEVMSLLTHLYVGADALTHYSSGQDQLSYMTLSPDIYAAQTLLAQIASRPDQDESDRAESDALTGSLHELIDMHWPSCSEQQFLQLLEMLGAAVYAASAGAAAATAQVSLPYTGAAERAAAEAGGSSSNNNSSSRSQAAELQQLSEALGTSLVLAALRPAQLLMDMAGLSNRAGSSRTQQPSVSSHFTNWRSIIPTIDGWRPVRGNVMALLAVHAYYQLLVAYSRIGGEEDIQNSLQEKAIAAGGFSAPAAALGLGELGVGTPAGWLYRGLLLQGLSLVALAGDPSPWRLPAAALGPLIKLVSDLVQGCPHLAAQMWDGSVMALQPLRCFMDDACGLFPAFLSPFLRLATALIVGPEAAEACYDYLSKRPPLVVEFATAQEPGLQVDPTGSSVYLDSDLPWPKAPEVIGTVFPGNIYGAIKPLPEFAQRPQAPPADQDMADQGPPGAGSAAAGPFLVAWDLQADQGMAQVLLLARAAHCLQKLHEMDTARVQVAGTDEWQDLQLILSLVATLLRNQPQLADALLAVSIDYNNGQKLDWVDIIIAALNVLPGLAGRTAEQLHSRATYTPSFAAGSKPGSSSAGSSTGSFAWAVLNSIADCLSATAAAAACQPSRVLTALCSCQLLEGVVAAAEPLPLVAVEDLGGWVQQHQTLSGSEEDWSTLGTLQALQQMLEVPEGRYPLTRAVVNLVTLLLAQQSTWGPVPGLVGFTLHRVLGALPWLPFAEPSDRWDLAAEALAAVRMAITAGSQGQPWASGPKGFGPPSGVMVTVLAARMVHHLATAGHGYLLSALPPPAPLLQAMADQVEGNSQLMQAAMTLAVEMLRLVPLLLGACAHLSPEMPLQQYWGVEPPGGGMPPLAVITSYVLYAYSAELQLLARQALNTFAILQAPSLMPSSRPGFRGGVTTPGGGGPAVPLGPSTAAGLAVLQGPVQPGLNPAHALGHRGHYGIAGTGLGVESQGGAGGWFRGSGLFARLLSSLPGLKRALVEPLRPEVAAHEPEMALTCLALLEAGVRYHPEILDALCFPSSLQPADAADDTAAAAGSSSSSSSKAAAPAFSCLDGLLQLLKQVPQLMSSNPRLLASVLRVLALLWECQAAAHGAVDILRAQPDLWTGLKACLPVAAHLPSFKVDQHLQEGEAAAWQLQVHAAAMRILLTEVHLNAQPAAEAGEEGTTPASAAGRESLLSSFGPQEVVQLLTAAADLGLQTPLLTQLEVLLQITYLQVGALAVTGAWSPSPLKSDAVRVGAQFRAEVQSLIHAVNTGQFTQQDLAAASQLLANVASQRDDAAALQFGEEGNQEDGGMEAEGPSSSSSGNARVLMDLLLRRPMGEVLLSYAAVSNSSWGPGETEYGTSFLFSSDRVLAALGTSLLSQSEALAPLCTSLDELSVSVSVGHARLVLLQAAAALFVSLAQQQRSRQLLLQPEVSQGVMTSCLKAVDRALREAIQLSTSQAAPLLSAPWGLHVVAHASSSALLATCRTLLQAVRFWKAATAIAGPTWGLIRSSSVRVKPALMARTLNHQNSLQDKQQQQQAGKRSSGGTAAAEAGSRGNAAVSDTIKASAQCASILSRWLRGAGGGSLAMGAAAAVASAAVLQEHVESIECLGTSLLLMLQALPAQQLAAARAALGRVAAGADAAAASPAELLELEAALLELLPALCKACAVGVRQQQGSSPADGTPSTAAELPGRQAHVAVLLQLLIEVLRHQLPPTMWLQPVSRHLELVPMLTAVSSRAHSSTGPLAPIASAASNASSNSSTAAAAAAAVAAVGVTDISVLELLQAVAEVPEGALQLWQQGVLPVLVGFCRQLLHGPGQSGLLGAAALGYTEPDAGVLGRFGSSFASMTAAAAAAEFPPPSPVMVSTVGAYTTTDGSAGGSNSNSNSSSDTVVLWSPCHQQWCLLLSLWVSVMQQLSRSVHVADVAVEFLTAAEPRLQLATQLLSSSAQAAHSSSTSQAASDTGPDSAASRAVVLAMTGFTPDGQRPGAGRNTGNSPILLTLGNLLEAERALQLLKFMVNSTGDWEVQRPGSMASFRAAAASLVEFVAAPALDRSFRVSCSPLSPFERRLAATPSGLTATEGWFKVCFSAGANAPQLAGAAAAAAAGAATSSALALVPASSEPGTPPAAAGTAGVGCSEYCAKLSEAMYTLCDHALTLLVATAPAVDPDEVASGQGLGPMWPSVRALAAVLDQALAVGESMVGSPATPLAAAPSPRRARIAATCSRVTAAAGRLLGVLNPGGHWGAAAAGRRTPAAMVGEEVVAARRFERMASLQRAASSIPSI